MRGTALCSAIPGLVMLIDSVFGSQVARAMVGISFAVAEASRANSVEELRRLVADFEASGAEARDACAAYAGLAERLGDGRDRVPEAERPAAIELLLGLERYFVETGRLVAEHALASERRAAADAPHLLPLLRRMTVLLHEEVRRFAEPVRDARWALLELEAAAEPAADGPVLAGPAEVGSFLQGLRAAP